MVPIYDAANSTDAHLMKNLLEQAGIASYIRGEYLQGGLGDLPVNGMVQVCVAESDAERARSVVADWKAGTIEPFDEMESHEEPAEFIAAPQAKPGSGRILWAIVGAAAGAALTWALVRGPVEQYHYDLNGDGRFEDVSTYAGGKLERAETDRNRDGKVDSIYEYDRNGLAVHSESDDDFDGRMEVQSRFLHGDWIGNEIDRNGDGAIDYESDAVSGVIHSERWRDADGRVVKRVLFKNGFADTGEVDTDGDGVLDTRHFYDRIGEISRKQPM
ncbi:MAG TPA: DUF2007 domain-containing protein [Luteimonas sp.]|nr:DUF2007 domain-containing protein [Luteimonas sp.]